MNDVAALLSELDCQRFGRKVARVDHFDGSEAEAIDQLRALGCELVISRIEQAHADRIRRLEDLGFRVFDCQLTLRRSLADFSRLPAAPQCAGTTLRKAVISDIGAIMELAQGAFETYGHYHADTRLETARCREIYPDWAARSARSEGTFVFEEGGRIVGFLGHELRGEHVAGSIGAVSREHRGRGYMRRLAHAGLHWAAQVGAEWVEHNVLASNYAIQRSLTGLGFRVAGCAITLHGWLAPRAPGAKQT